MQFIIIIKSASTFRLSWAISFCVFLMVCYTIRTLGCLGSLQLLAELAQITVKLTAMRIHTHRNSSAPHSSSFWTLNMNDR